MTRTDQGAGGAPGTPALPTHLDGIDGLRGLAALIVVVYHLFTNSGNPEWRPLSGLNVLRPLHDGWCGVNLFLVLSGFCLFWPLARDPARPLHFGRFMQRRLWRIMPAYYISLALVPLAFWGVRQMGFWHGNLQTPVSPKDAVLHVLMLHAFSAEAFRSWNGVTWSLGLEWIWYLAFPLAVWLFRRLRPWQALLGLALVNLVYSGVVYALVGPSDPAREDYLFTLRSFLPGRLAEFGAGMLVASFLARRPVPGQATLAALVLIPALLGLSHLLTPVDPILPARNFVYGAAFALLVLVTAGGRENLFQRVMTHPWMKRTGECSYSLYLFHMPVVALITGLLACSGLDGTPRFFISLLSVPLLIGLARLQYAAFERPFLAMAAPRKPAAALETKAAP